jgi:hypothetical protein
MSEIYCESHRPEWCKTTKFVPPLKTLALYKVCMLKVKAEDKIQSVSKMIKERNEIAKSLGVSKSVKKRKNYLHAKKRPVTKKTTHLPHANMSKKFKEQTPTKIINY